MALVRHENESIIVKLMHIVGINNVELIVKIVSV